MTIDIPQPSDTPCTPPDKVLQSMTTAIGLHIGNFWILWHTKNTVVKKQKILVAHQNLAHFKLCPLLETAEIVFLKKIFRFQGLSEVTLSDCGLLLCLAFCKLPLLVYLKNAIWTTVCGQPTYCFPSNS